MNAKLLAEILMQAPEADVRLFETSSGERVELSERIELADDGVILLYFDISD